MSERNEHPNPSPNRSGRVALRVMGISYSQIQSGAYALILAEVGGPYRIPVVVGAAEAQSIAIKLEGIIPPRPMTHDLFAALCHAYGLELKEVFIEKFEEGIFYSQLTFEDVHGKEVTLDARTSDAIAIAMRTGAPIFTTSTILEETGFILEVKEAEPEMPTDAEVEESLNGPDLASLPLEELHKLLAQAIDNEAYEEAARISAIINHRS